MPDEVTRETGALPELSISALLAFVGGYLDGYTYLNHGHVFANAMTGNVVLLGLNSISGSWRTGLRHLPPILMFLLGISAARGLQLERAARVLRRPHLVVLAIEIFALLVLSLQPKTTPDIWFTATIAFVAAMQVESFNKIHGKNYNSTFTTGNLRTLSEALFDWFARKRDAETATIIQDFAVICAAFGLGAAAASVAASRFGNRCLWLEVVLLLVVATWAYKPTPGPRAG